MGGQMFIHLQKSRTPACATVTREDKFHYSKHPPLLLFPPNLHTEHDAIWFGISFWSVWATQLCPTPTSDAHPVSFPPWQYKKQKRPWVCAIPVQQWQKHLCITNPEFSTNLKHNPIPATLMKIIPAKTSTLAHFLSLGFSASPGHFIDNHVSYLVLTFELELLKAFWIFLDMLQNYLCGNPGQILLLK